MSTTIKLHEATKQFKISNKLAMHFLEKINLPVKSHSSVITVDQLELLRELTANPKKISTLEAELAKGGTGKKAPAASSPKVDSKGPTETKKAAGKKPAPEKKESAKKPAEIKVHEKKAPEKKAFEKTAAASPPKGGTSPKEDKLPSGAKKAVPEKQAAAPADKPSVASAPKPAAAPPAAHSAAPPVVAKPAAAPAPRPAPPAVPRPFPGPQRIFRPTPQHGRRPPYQQSQRRSEPRPAPRPKKEIIVEPLSLPAKIQITDFCTVKELAEKLTIKLKLLEDKIAQLKMNYLGNQIMESADIDKLCADFGVALEILTYEDFVFQTQVAKSGEKMSPRPPVVTVMGHVDHGKTTLLDTLRKTRVAEKEAGGITQKIGAYKLRTPEGTIVFVDTPGHEAFTNLRARGAKVTDLVILVVAANDGVQPQTIEAIHHAQAAGVPMIVAINKIDIQGADIEKIKQDLNKNNILVESWGGKVVSVEISAKNNINLDTLLEMIQLTAQIQELQAFPHIPARGTIIESRLDPQLGPIGTVLIQHGQLKKGDYFICGSSLGKIKSIYDDNGNMLNSAQVPDPIEIMGFEAVPQAGDIFQVVDDLEKAKKIIEMRQINQKASKNKDFLAEKKLSLQNLFQMVELEKIQAFPVIVKADNFGSAEVLGQILDRLSQEKLKIEIMHSGLGNITEGDILLASAAGAVILGFNVKAPQKILSMAKMEKVEIRLYSVIYHLVEDIEKAVKGKIGPQYQETLIGKVEILQKFKISKVGIVAGCVVREGKVTRKSKIKVMRESDLVFAGEIESLKRIKDEVSEVRAGTECGIRIKNFSNIEPGDILEIFETSIIP
ncbi:MAG: translation initiation factor IF-2 [Candidatus Aminicenantes bacterium]|nr:translation initiation factor IF-2 [Candidatus Aminicenantes bacterium]